MLKLSIPLHPCVSSLGVLVLGKMSTDGSTTDPEVIANRDVESPEVEVIPNRARDVESPEVIPNRDVESPELVEVTPDRDVESPEIIPNRDVESPDLFASNANQAGRVVVDPP